MAKAKTSPARNGRLKVYMTQIGFHKWLVAAPSQKAALAAWDVRENLFAMGSAEQVTDPACVDLAMKTPGAPVPVDAQHAFAKASKVLRLDDHRSGTRPRDDAKSAKPVRQKTPPRRKRRIDRSRLDKAEAALAAFRKRALRDRAAIVRAQKALDLKAEALEEALDAEEDDLTTAWEEAQAAYEAEARA